MFIKNNYNNTYKIGLEIFKMNIKRDYYDQEELIISCIIVLIDLILIN